MIRIIISALFSFIAIGIFSQVPSEQDCLGAIPVCQYVFIQNTAYSGEGNYPFELPVKTECPDNCLDDGEKNDVWYTISALSDGLLGFTITPHEDIDYDWAVYSMNDYSCTDLLEHISEMQVSCNFAKAETSFVTGPNGGSGLNCQGISGTPFNDLIPVKKGEIYVINVSRYSSLHAGYTLDFSVSTAELFNDEGPQLGTVDTTMLSCGTNSLTFNFTGKVICDSIFAEDFVLNGPGGPFTISNIYSEACLLGNNFSNRFTMEFEPYLIQNGEYQIKVLPEHPLYDACDKFSDSMSLTFHMNIIGPDADAGIDQFINEGTETVLQGVASNGNPPYAYAWYPVSMIAGSNTIPNPTTVVLYAPQDFRLIVTDSLNCVSDSALVTVFTIEELTAFPLADPPEVCPGDSVLLIANALGGGGEYTYNWTSDEPGWSFSGDSVTVNPLKTTNYSLTVEDSASSFSADVLVFIKQRPQVDLVPDNSIIIGEKKIRACVDDTVVLDAGNPDNPVDMLYEWSNQANNRYYVAKSNGIWVEEQTYWVAVTNQITICSNSDTLTILFDFSECAIGVGEVNYGKSDFVIYPNPTTGVLTIYSKQNDTGIEIEVLDLQGKKVLTQKVDQVDGQDMIKLDLNILAEGIYLLRIISDSGFSVHKIVKK